MAQEATIRQLRQERDRISTTLRTLRVGVAQVLADSKLSDADKLSRIQSILGDRQLCQGSGRTLSHGTLPV